MLEGALDCKFKWNAEIERCQKPGIEVPRLLPAPDDIVINFRTGEVTTKGPLADREKASYEGIAQCRRASRSRIYGRWRCKMPKAARSCATVIRSFQWRGANAGLFQFAVDAAPEPKPPHPPVRGK